MSKKTIAIIGATENMGSALAKSLAKGNYRLLLFAHDTKKLNSLAEEIKKQTLSADIEPMGCAAEASWEADIIIPDIPVNEENEMAKKIRQFANRKIVITNGKEDLQKLLPGARVIRVFNPSVEINFSSPLIDGKQTDAFIAGSDKEALDTVA